MNGILTNVEGAARVRERERKGRENRVKKSLKWCRSLVQHT